MVQEARRLIQMVACVVLVACAADRAVPASERTVADNGGWSLRLVIRRPSTRQYELYDVDLRGYAGYAGGMDAMNGEVKHRFPLTPEAATKYRQAMTESPWTQAKPEDLGPANEEPLTDVTIQARGGVERKFTLRGPQPEVERFVAILRPVLAQRHDRVLDKVPRATEGPRPAGEQAKPASGD
jgi:hypothetical protein